MSATAPTVEPRPASTPSTGGLRDAIKGAILVALLKLGLSPELSDTVAVAVGAMVLGVLGFAGRFLRDYAASGKAPGWLGFVLRLLPL